jgi:hypothetical protein
MGLYTGHKIKMRRNHFGSILRSSLALYFSFFLWRRPYHIASGSAGVYVCVNSRAGELVHNLFIVHLSIEMYIYICKHS